MTIWNVFCLTVLWFMIDIILLVFLIALLRGAAPTIGIQWPIPWSTTAYWVLLFPKVKHMSAPKPLVGFGKIFVWHRERFL